MPLLSLKLTRSQPFRLRAGAFRQKKQHTQGLSVGQCTQRNECPQILFVPLPCSIQPFHLSNPQLYTITPPCFFLFSCHLSLPFSLDKTKNVIQWVHELVRERGEIWCVEVWKGVYWVPGGGSSPPSLHQGTSSPTSLPCDSWPPHPPSYKTLFSWGACHPSMTPPSLCQGHPQIPSHIPYCTDDRHVAQHLPLQPMSCHWLSGISFKYLGLSAPWPTPPPIASTCFTSVHLFP